jgi:hypothetical protein
MKERIKAILDNRATWATIGVFAGSLLGEKAVLIINGVGALVMAIL